MQEQNKNNAIFLGGVILSLLTIFFTVVMLRGKVCWWSAPLPVAAIGYGLFVFIKKVRAYRPDKKEDKK